MAEPTKTDIANKIKVAPIIALNNNENLWVYILLLANNKIYVGQTVDLNHRINTHFTNNGSSYTKKYKPKEIAALISNCTNSTEQDVVKFLMEEYGWNNVRGAGYSQSHKIKKKPENVIVKYNNNVVSKDKIFNKLKIYLS